MNETKRKSFLFLVLIVLILLAGLFQFREYNLFQISQSRIDNHIKFFDLIKNRRTALTAKDVPLIQSWMTFDYINVMFKLPSDYLKIVLNISNAAYPKISLIKYSKIEKVDITNFLVSVKKVVSDFSIKK